LENKEENLVKKTCRELGITQKELAEKIGITESGLKTALFRNNLSNQIIKNIELLLENYKLKLKLEKTEEFKTNLKEFLS
jgi:transcriptional regulator with XRE-family HTH domain